MTYKRGDAVLALGEDGPTPAVVFDPPFLHGEFTCFVLCSPEDWAIHQAGGTPGDMWDEWRYHWPVEAIEHQAHQD